MSSNKSIHFVHVILNKLVYFETSKMPIDNDSNRFKIFDFGPKLSLWFVVSLYLISPRFNLFIKQFSLPLNFTSIEYYKEKK